MGAAPTAALLRKLESGRFVRRKPLSAMQQQCPKLHQHKLMLLMRFANEFEEATVPDPYYGGPEGFEHVLDLLEDGCQGLLRQLQQNIT